MHPALGLHRDIGAQHRHVRAGNRANAVVGLAGHPGNDRAIVEADGIFAAHPDCAATAAQDANKVAAPIGSKGHEIDETDYAMAGLELSLQDGRGSRYRRDACTLSAVGVTDQKPLSGLPSRAAKTAPESKRGQHSQSIEPSRPTRAAVSQSPIRA